MKSNSDETGQDLLAHVLSLIADHEGAQATATELDPYRPGRGTASHVVEKGGGVPDKTPVEQSEEIAAESYAAVRTVFPDTEEHTAYARAVVRAIFDAAGEVEASVILCRSRGGNRLVEYLSGDLSLKLVTNANRPVIALPRVDSNA